MGMQGGEGSISPGAFPQPPSLLGLCSGAQPCSKMGSSQRDGGEQDFYSPLVLPRAIQPLLR